MNAAYGFLTTIGEMIFLLEAPPFPVDLLVTSPPYADAIDYTFAQRLSLYLIGYDDFQIKNISNVEIGARRKGPNRHQQSIGQRNYLKP
jgi:DNA modification methylase